MFDGCKKLAHIDDIKLDTLCIEGCPVDMHDDIGHVLPVADQHTCTLMNNIIKRCDDNEHERWV